jgi:hypothetical protein
MNISSSSGDSVVPAGRGDLVGSVCSVAGEQRLWRGYYADTLQYSDWWSEPSTFRKARRNQSARNCRYSAPDLHIAWTRGRSSSIDIARRREAGRPRAPSPLALPPSARWTWRSASGRALRPMVAAYYDPGARHLLA